MEPIIKLRNLVKVYHVGDEKLRALDGVNLAGVAANGKRVVQNLLEALAPILQQGAQRHLEARAEAAEAEAAAKNQK